jgi:hypothetical protein
MPMRRRKGFWRSLRHKCCVAVSLVAYLAAAIGFPLPASAPAKGDRPCGCPALDQCRHQCCCFKPGGRLAGDNRPCATAVSAVLEPQLRLTQPWHTPAAWDAELLSHEAEAVADSAGPRASGSCCSHRKARSGPATSERPACCQGGKHLPACCAKPAPAMPPPASGAGLRWVPGLSAPSCQGVTTFWVSGGAALPPPPAVSWGPRLDPVGWLPVHDAFTSPLPSCPPVPPPRTSRA